MRFADIAVNLTDPMFQGIYHGKPKHEPDLDLILTRAQEAGVEKIIITGTSLSGSQAALEMAKTHNLQCTAGVHPTSTKEIEAHKEGIDDYFRHLEHLIRSDLNNEIPRIISVGEIGLDYDRLHFSPKETQLAHLPRLLGLSKSFNLPLFLHSRHPEAHVDLVEILREAGWGSDWPGGVVHSFTGTVAEMNELVSMGLYIGINGCSLKTPQNLEVVKAIPLGKLLLETDAPWCGLTTSHASFKHIPKNLTIVDKVKPEKFILGKGVKGRNEPAEVVTIAHVVASVRGIELEEVVDAVWENTQRLFYPRG